MLCSVFAPLLMSISSLCLDLCRFMFPVLDCALAVTLLSKVFAFSYREKQGRIFIFFYAALLEGKGSCAQDGRIDS